MARVVLHHRHAPAECGRAFAAWRGVRSPLRGAPALCSCALGGHELWWVLDADGSEEALELLPPWLRDRSDATEVREVAIP